MQNRTARVHLLNLSMQLQQDFHFYFFTRRIQEKTVLPKNNTVFAQKFLDNCYSGSTKSLHQVTVSWSSRAALHRVVVPRGPSSLPPPRRARPRPSSFPASTLPAKLPSSFPPLWRLSAVRFRRIHPKAGHGSIRYLWLKLQREPRGWWRRGRLPKTQDRAPFGSGPVGGRILGVEFCIPSSISKSRPQTIDRFLKTYRFSGREKNRT